VTADTAQGSPPAPSIWSFQSDQAWGRDEISAHNQLVGGIRLSVRGTAMAT